MAIVNVPGHFVAVVAYDSTQDKYLLLDSAPTSSRKTSGTGKRWMSSGDFTGKLEVKTAHLISSTNLTPTPVPNPLPVQTQDYIFHIDGPTGEKTGGKRKSNL